MAPRIRRRNAQLRFRNLANRFQGRGTVLIVDAAGQRPTACPPIWYPWLEEPRVGKVRHILLLRRWNCFVDVRTLEGRAKGVKREIKPSGKAVQYAELANL